MNLPFLSKKEEQKDFFLAFIVTHARIGAILFEKSPNNLLILATHEQNLLKTPEDLTDEELVDFADKVVSAVEPSLPSGVEVSRTIFAVPNNWVEDVVTGEAGKIKHDYLVKLKKVCDTLALVPIGFIVTSEAINAFLHKKEGVPVAALFVEMGNIITLTLVKNGKVEAVHTKESEDQSPVSVEEVLKEAQFDSLPARIILLNSGDSKKLEQQFMAHQWSKSLPFLHLPRVLALDRGFENEAIINGVATQMGFDILHNVEAASTVEKNEVPDLPQESQHIDETSSHAIPDTIEDQKVDVVDADKNKTEPAAFSISTEEFGFKREEDVLKKEIEKEREKVAFEAQSAPVVRHAMESHMEQGTEAMPIVEQQASAGLPKFSMPHFSFPSFAALTGGKSMLVAPLLVLLFLVLGSFLYYFLVEKADVTVFLDRREVKKEIPVTFATDAETSAKESVLHIETLSVQIDGSAQTDATGKKATGNKAQGQVTLYNKTDGSKNFSKGTKLSGPNSTTFVTLDDVTVASTSAFSTTFSSAKVKIEASTFGKEFNLPSGSNFSVDSFSSSDYFAKNDSAFSGGTKKEVQVVSKKDLDILVAQVIDTLTKQALQEARSKVSGDESVLSEPLNTSFDQKDYSKKVDQEATSVNLSAKISFKLGIYKNNDAISILEQAAGGIPASYKIHTGSTIEVKDLETTEDTITGKLNVNANFVPQIDSQALSKMIKMKSVGAAETILKQQNGVTDVNIAIRNKIPFLSNVLPASIRNINVIIKTE